MHFLSSDNGQDKQPCPLGYAALKTGKNDLGISGCRLQLHSQTHSSPSIPISLAAARDSDTAASRIDVIDDLHLFVRLSVCLFVCRQNAKKAIF